MSRSTKNLAWFFLIFTACADATVAQNKVAQDNVAQDKARDKPDAPAPKAAAGPKGSDHQSHSTAPSGPGPGQQQDENPKRILGIIPNFESKDDIPQNRVPMTPREKYA